MISEPRGDVQAPWHGARLIESLRQYCGPSAAAILDLHRGCLKLGMTWRRARLRDVPDVHLGVSLRSFSRLVRAVRCSLVVGGGVKVRVTPAGVAH